MIREHIQYKLFYKHDMNYTLYRFAKLVEHLIAE